MSEDQLYELARKQIDRKNRRWLLWAVNFFVFLLYVGAFTAFSGIPRNVGAFLLQAWFALLVLHTTALVLMQEQEQGIGGEVARLRRSNYEKPKRAEFSDEGEFMESLEVPRQHISHR